MISPNDVESNDDEFDFEEDYAGMVLTGTFKEELEHDSTFIKTSDLFDPSFEVELGCSDKIFTDQDIIDQEFGDIVKLNIVQVSGDDKSGKKVIVFYACRLPPANRINLARLWQYTTKTLKQFVSNDYSLIYFHHGLTNKNNPGIGFLLNAYKEIDRDFKKNLKNVFIVHPSTVLNVIVDALLPFFSQKVRKKIIKVRKLKDLESQFYVDQLVIPETIRTYDSKMNSPDSLDKLFSVSKESRTFFYEDCPNPQFGVTLQQIRHIYPSHSLPPVMEQCIKYLRKDCLQSEGLFRRCTSKTLLDEVQHLFNNDEHVNLEQYEDAHLTACLLKTFLRSLSEPLMTFDLFDDIIKIHNCGTDSAMNHIHDIITNSLPDYNYHVLKHLIEFLREVAVYSDHNKMTLQNLANVFGPSLAWSRHESSIMTTHVIIKFTYLLLLHSDIIFTKTNIY